MFHFIAQKLKNKKWMNASIFLGITMLVAMMSALPMFEKGAGNNLLLSGFAGYIREYNKCPSSIGKTKVMQKDKISDLQSVLSDSEDYQKIWLQYLNLKPVAVQNRVMLAMKSAKGDYCSGSCYLQIACMPELTEHIDILNGTGYEEDNTCLISEVLMDQYGLVSGETLTFDMKDENGNPVALKIAGIFDVADRTDLYWYDTPDTLAKTVFVSQKLFDRLLKTDVDTVTYQCNMMFDYHDINCENEKKIKYYLDEFHRLDKDFFDDFSSVLNAYEKNAKTASVMIRVLELPVLVLLLAFIYMVSNQIMEMESGEIAMLKGRGAAKWQIVRLYAFQSLILNAMAFVPGLLLGIVFCKLAAGTDGFMQFTLNNAPGYVPTLKMLPFGLLALLVADLFIILPVFKHEKASVVEHKRKNVKKKEKPFWSRYYLDVILLGISTYLLYNYGRQKDVTALAILQGESVDPIMFLDAVFFVLAAGLLSLRLLHILIRLLYHFGEKRFSPAFYTSFLQMIRTFYKQGFLHIFIIMTIAMGSFYANMAQTVNSNKTERIIYDLGADVVLEEPFKLNIYHPQRDVTLWQYEEPDYARYEGLAGDVCEGMTKVIEDDNTEVRISGKRVEGCHLMAVQTKEFGQLARLRDGLNDRHWYYALNELAATPNGVIISDNMAREYDLKVGDELICSRFSPLKNEQGKEYGMTSAVICAIVKAWPAHLSYRYDYNEQGEVLETPNYLLVTNYAYTASVFGITPYKIWLRLKNGSSVDDVKDYLEKQGIEAEVQSVSENVSEMKSSALIQITNGMFTLSFIVAVILCIVGFYIYWFNSIKQRELLLGIYRAMGMRMSELKTMLINEQIFSSLFAAVFGGGIGVVATVLFAKLLALVYLPTKHNIDLFLVFGGMHLVRLALLFVVMFVVCVWVLWRQVKAMKIAQALKLGED